MYKLAKKRYLETKEMIENKKFLCLVQDFRVIYL